MDKKTYESIKDDLEDKIIEYINDDNREFVRQGIISLFKLKESSRLESYTKRVNNEDRMTKNNRVLVLLYGIILLGKRKSFSNGLSDDALMLFTHYYRDYELMDDDIASCNPELLEEVCKKAKTLSERSDYYFVALNLLEENENEDVIERIKTMDKNEFSKLRNKYEGSDFFQKLIDSGDKEFIESIKKVRL